jgi:hypothetical protein
VRFSYISIVLSLDVLSICFVCPYFMARFDAGYAARALMPSLPDKGSSQRMMTKFWDDLILNSGAAAGSR